MLMPEQMEALRKAKGAEFDAYFDRDDSASQWRVDHGEGFVRHRGRGQDADLFNFASDADNTQRAGSESCRVCWRKNSQRRNDEPIAQHCRSRSVATLILCFGEPEQAQEPATPRRADACNGSTLAGSADADKDDKDKNDKDDEDRIHSLQSRLQRYQRNERSDANDPRAKLTPGLYDAGETAMGINMWCGQEAGRVSTGDFRSR